MSSSGFSAPVNYWGSINGLSLKDSEDGRSSSLAEAQNYEGDTVASDEYGDVIAPKCVYTVTGEFDLSDLALGTVYTYGTTNARKLMLTSVEVSTSAGATPTVTLSGVQVESGAATKRTYALSGTVTPRTKAQDPAGAFETSTKYTSFDTTFEVDSDVPTIAGSPVASDCFHGRVTVRATMTDHDGTGAVTLGTGFAFSAAPSQSNPDGSYITREATAVKFLAGTDASAQSGT